MGKASGWTPERRAKAAERMRRRKPWEKSTGPKTEAGKATASRNAYKGGHRPRHRAKMRLMKESGKAALEMIALMRAAHTGNMLDWGMCIDPGFASSDAFLDAQARYERASAAYWRLVCETDDPATRWLDERPGDDLPALAAAVLARMGLDDEDEE